MKSARSWFVIARGGQSPAGSVTTQCLLFALGIWIALGAVWTDMAVQERFLWSPLGGSAAPGEGRTLEAGSITFRGTTPKFLDLQSDLALGLNAAFPFEALGMKPFLPYVFKQRVGFGGSDTDHRWFAAVWLAVPLASLLLLAFKGRQRRVALVSSIALALIYFGLLVALQWLGVGEGLDQQLDHRIVSAPFVAMLLLALSLCAIAIVGAAWIASRAKAGLHRSNSGKIARACISRAWLCAALMGSFLGLTAKGALWLGWYTNDTRVNLLEPLAVGAALAALALAIATELSIRWLWRLRARRPWRRGANATWLVVIVALIATAAIPNPPQLANWTGEGEYILKGGNELVAYGDRDASLREGIPRNLRGLTNSSTAREADPQPQRRESPAIQLINFNSANLYSHLFGMPWLQLLLIPFVIGCMASISVLGASTLAALLGGCIRVALANRSVMLAAALQSVSLGILFALLGWTGISAIRSHAMDQALMHARGQVVLNHAFRAFTSYRAGNESSEYWRLPWANVPLMYRQFDATFAQLLRAEAKGWRGIGDFGAVDNLYFANDGELRERIQRVEWALRQRQSLFALCETFPDTLRFQLERYGFPKHLIESAVASWTRELKALRAVNLIRIRRLSAEAELLSALERIQDFWSVDRPGMLPTFGQREHLAAYTDDLSGIVDLKEAEIRGAGQLQRRLPWIDGDVDTDGELRLVAGQREALSCLAKANQRAEAAGREFDAPALAQECTAPMQKLEAVRATVAKR
jgi:hypothetical protein